MTTNPAPAPSPAPTPAPTPTPTPTPDPELVVSASPALDAVRDLDAPVPAPITGTGTAGASVALIDETGSTLATTAIAADGRFSTVIPGDLLRVGLTVRAIQTAPGAEPSAASPAVGPFTLPLVGALGERAVDDGALVGGHFSPRRVALRMSPGGGSPTG